MSMIHHPGLIILDEPTSALDVSVQAQIMNLLKSLKLQGISMIFITHDIALTSDLCDNLAVMKDGKFIEYDSLANVLTNPKHDFTKQLIQSVPSLSLSIPSRKLPSTKKSILDFENINKLEIPTGNPLLVKLDSDLKFISAYYLDETRAQTIIQNK